jgi:hypothetical protein
MALRRSPASTYGINTQNQYGVNTATPNQYGIASKYGVTTATPNQYGVNTAPAGAYRQNAGAYQQPYNISPFTPLQQSAGVYQNARAYQQPAGAYGRISIPDGAHRQIGEGMVQPQPFQRPAGVYQDARAYQQPYNISPFQQSAGAYGINSMPGTLANTMYGVKF